MVNMDSNSIIDFGASVQNFKERKVDLQPQRLHIRLPNARNILFAGLKHFLGDTFK